MDTLPVTEARMQAEIEALRAQYPETQDLYREVCVLLFFRYGLTPTANKLYQLVRKGSMSAPAEALARFWETLREKSRVRIEHPDLPQPLQAAAGEMVGALWQQAQAAAQDTLAQHREEARATVVAAEGLAQSAGARADAAEAALGTTRDELRPTQGGQWSCKASWPAPRARSPPSNARSKPPQSTARSCRQR
ncbi:MAG: DNA-binding protein [Ramlibacter sp.]|nr:DNA-binding protein [Ramlibacter sp.]